MAPEGRHGVDVNIQLMVGSQGSVQGGPDTPGGVGPAEDAATSAGDAGGAGEEGDVAPARRGHDVFDHPDPNMKFVFDSAEEGDDAADETGGDGTSDRTGDGIKSDGDVATSTGKDQ